MTSTSAEEDDSDDASPAQTPSPTLAPAVASTPSPVVTGTSTDDDATSAGTPSPITAPSPQDNDDDGDDDGVDGDSSEFDCSACEDLTDAQIEALAKYDDDGGKAIVCDPTCLDGVSDPLHCNCELYGVRDYRGFTCRY